MDTLHITDIRAYGYTGYFAAEQQLGQWFAVDITFWTDLSKAGETDELSDTLDYSQVVLKVQEIITTSKFKMIERLAQTIASTLLTSTQAQQIKVRLTKCQPPIPDFGGEVAIEITRARSD